MIISLQRRWESEKFWVRWYIHIISSRGLVGCDTVLCCGRIPTFQRFPEDGSSMNLWNIGILPQHNTVSQPRRPRLEISPPWKPPNSHVYYPHAYSIFTSI